jgi:hemolysin activation/secretion protein
MERVQIDLSADNNGLKETGRYEFSAGSQFYNVISNDSMILNGAISDKHNKFQMFSGGYLKRLRPGTSLSGLASFIKDQPYPRGGGAISSTTISYKGRFDQYLVLNDDYSVKLEVGLEERDLVYYDQTVKDNDYHYFLGSIGGKIKINDPANGENWLYPYYNHTIKKAFYNKSSAQSQNFDGNFGFFVLDWYRTQQLSDKFSFLLKASYQGTNNWLPTDQQYAIGTQHTIRGYTIGMVASDQGVSGELELRYTHNLQGAYKKFVETLQVFGFYGATGFIDHNKTATSTNHPGNIYFDKSTLQSAGGGLRFSFPYKIYGEAIVAQPLTRHINVNGVNKTNSTVYSFLVSKNFSW